jgi:hypothetical protein
MNTAAEMKIKCSAQGHHRMFDATVTVSIPSGQPHRCQQQLELTTPAEANKK